MNYKLQNLNCHPILIIRKVYSYATEKMLTGFSDVHTLIEELISEKFILEKT